MKKYPPVSLLLLLTVICLVGFGTALAGPKTCASCGKPITNGSWVEVEGKAYHSEHFCCAKCGRPIGDSPYWTIDSQYYDSTCYVNHIAPRCDYCGEAIVDEWVTSDSGTYHPSCYYDHVVARCFVCNQPISGAYFFDGFGQKIGRAHV